MNASHAVPFAPSRRATERVMTKVPHRRTDDKRAGGAGERDRCGVLGAIPRERSFLGVTLPGRDKKMQGGDSSLGLRYQGSCFKAWNAAWETPCFPEDQKTISIGAHPNATPCSRWSGEVPARGGSRGRCRL